MKHYGDVGSGEFYTRVYAYRQPDDEAMLLTDKPRIGWAPEGYVDAYHDGGIGTSLPEIEAAERFLVKTEILERGKHMDDSAGLWFKNPKAKTTQRAVLDLIRRVCDNTDRIKPARTGRTSDTSYWAARRCCARWMR